MNDYCPAISLAWKANTDVQFILSSLHDVIAYVTGYTTKSESAKEGGSVQSRLKEANNSTDAFKALVDLVRMRDVGMLEIIDLLMGHSCFEFDSAHTFVNTNRSDKRYRFLRPRDSIKDDDEKAYKNNAYDQYYPQRHKALEEVSLYSMVVQFTTEKPTGAEAEIGNQARAVGYHASANPFRFLYHIDCKKSPFYCFPAITTRQLFAVTDTNTSHRKRKKPLIPRLYWPRLEIGNEESREDYYRRLCYLFIPWRYASFSDQYSYRQTSNLYKLY